AARPMTSTAMIVSGSAAIFHTTTPMNNASVASASTARITSTSMWSPRSLSISRSFILGRNCGCQPPGRAQQPRIVAAPADHLHPDRQALFSLQQWERNRRHAAERPQRAEYRASGRFQSKRRDTGRRWSDDRVEPVENPVEAQIIHLPPVHGPRVIDRQHLATLG